MSRRFLAAAVLVATLLCLFSGCAEKRVDGGQLRVGVSSAVTGELGMGQWETTEADALIRGLVDGGSPVICSDSGEYSVDNRYAKNVTGEYLSDGSKVFTVEICEGILWSDGAEITAADYVASILLFSGSAAKGAGASGMPGGYYVGAEEYAESGVFKGVHLIDKYKFSVTVASENVPYYWELSYIDILPLDMSLWLPEGVGISDGSGGCGFTSEITDEMFAESIASVRFAADERRSVGPYVFKGFAENSAVLERNPNYIPLSDEEKPSIEKLLFIETDGTAAAVENGKADIVVGAENVYADAVRLSAAGSFSFSVYGAEKLTDLVFQCDIGPTAFSEVRLASAYLCDRQTMAAKLVGDGAVVPDLMCTDALAQKLENGFSWEPFVRNQDRARGLLIEGGWTLNAAGDAHSSGLRYKLVTAQEAEDCIDAVILEDGRVLMPLRIRVACVENSGHSLFLADFAHAAETVGMEVVHESLSENEFFDRLTRNAADGIGYAVPLYNGFVTETEVETRGDLSARWTDDWRLVAEGSNPCFFEDEVLRTLSVKLAYGAENSEEFSSLWTEYTARWIETVPELPLCRAAVCDVYSNVLRGYSADDTRGFERAILCAWVNEEMR